MEEETGESVVAELSAIEASPIHTRKMGMDKWRS